MKRFNLYFWFVLFSAMIYTADFAQETPRKQINFDEDWKFAYGNASDPGKDFNYGIATIFSKSGGAVGTAIAPKFNDSSWRSLQLPHDWAVELPFVNSPSETVAAHGYKPVGGLFPETSIGWYRKHFRVAGADSGQRFQLQFDGIFRDATVWINGLYAGNHKSGYADISYDITNYLNYGGDNVVVVRVDATQYEGWFYEGAGIYRHVWLNQYNKVHIADNGIFVYTQVKDDPSGQGRQTQTGSGSNKGSNSGSNKGSNSGSNNGSGSGPGKSPANESAIVNIETTVENESFSPANAALSAVITDRDGKIIGRTAEQQLTLTVNEKKTIRQKINITRPRRWSLEDPYLYRVIPVIKAGNAIVDSKTLRFGVRTMEISDKGFFLNGKYTKIHGANNHQDHAGLGSALPDYLQYYRVRLLKDMGVNAYRTSHGPPAPELLDACDSLGMLVLDENRLLNNSPQYMADFEGLIRRDRSRASVFLWSIGNEEGWVQTTGVGRLIAQTLLAKQKELDPTRVSTYAADIPNVYAGINEVIPVRGFNYRQFAVEDYHRDHPHQPIIGTEMGSTVSTRGIYDPADSVKGYLPDQDISAPWWASKAEDWWKLAAPHDWWAGGFVWTGFDYRGEPTPFQWPVVSCHFGIMDNCGFPKNIYYYYQSWWSDKDVLHISPHWNWKGKEHQPIDVWVNTNADDVELFLNGKSLGKKDMPRNSHLQWSVPYEPGTLEAVAYKKGRKLTTRVETTGASYEVVVTPYKTTITADGKDATVMNISVLDKEGREVPDADNLIRFSIKGDAAIIGAGNGDPTSHEPDKYPDGGWQRHLFNGKCQVILQAGRNPEMIHFDAKAEGLQTGATDILSIHPGEVHPVTAFPRPFPVSAPDSRPGASSPKAAGANPSGHPVDKMLGADISFLPQLESRGMKFQDKGQEKDAIAILKDHGFNYVRLRIFNDPAGDSGYSPRQGFCDLEHTKQMAKRVKAAGLKLLLDFHYSDTWADPQKQYKPAAWRGEDFTTLRKSVYDYTKMVMLALKEQGTLPDMVQVGNEINHGMIWPEGQIGHPDSLAALIDAGINGVRAVAPSTTIMLHIALGGQNEESRFWLDNMNMIGRCLNFDVIGLSYYPRWHGTLADLSYNLNDLATHYNKDVIVVEYSYRKQEVNEIAFRVANGRGKGTCIWEPLSTWEKFFERDGKTNDLITVYDEIHQKFITEK